MRVGGGGGRGQSSNTVYEAFACVALGRRTAALLNGVRWARGGGGGGGVGGPTVTGATDHRITHKDRGVWREAGGLEGGLTTDFYAVNAVHWTRMHAAPRGRPPRGNNQRHFTREEGSDRRAGKHLASSGVVVGGGGGGEGGVFT